jgi:anaerobic magnesium-protoporphyrin IX monomethyl ester cyclase
LQKELEIESAFHFLSPFPGTAVREDIADYDLEILTHDWDQYNANRSIVKTSCLSAEQMDAFIHDATEQNREDWEVLKVKYANKTATPHEQMQVGGYYRMEMIFKLLTRDFLEQHSTFETSATAIGTLSIHIAAMAGLDLDFAEVTLKDLITKGYIQMETSRQKTRFFWAHNNQLKSVPA